MRLPLQPQTDSGQGRFPLPAAGRPQPSQTSNCPAFTLVEIALCLAIVGFAAVAIIGVLPVGMTAQKDNREETIVRQDGLFFLEAIRSGSRGIDDLTNYVDQIVWNASVYLPDGTLRRRVPTRTFAAIPSVSSESLISNGVQIVSLLTTPKYQQLLNGDVQVNDISAIVRSINGVAADKDFGNRDDLATRRRKREFAFKYQLRTELIPFVGFNANTPPGTPFQLRRESLLTNGLYNLHLTLSWPLFERGQGEWQVGGNRKTLRTLIAGGLDSASDATLFNPGEYANPFQ